MTVKSVGLIHLSYINDLLFRSPPLGRNETEKIKRREPLNARLWRLPLTLKGHTIGHQGYCRTPCNLLCQFQPLDPTPDARFLRLLPHIRLLVNDVGALVNYALPFKTLRFSKKFVAKNHDDWGMYLSKNAENMDNIKNNSHRNTGLRSTEIEKQPPEPQGAQWNGFLAAGPRVIFQ